MYTEILTEEQHKLLPLVKKFSRNFYLVGGTAIALIIGHRRSEDFDLFTEKLLPLSTISKTIALFAPGKVKLLAKDIDQVHYRVRDIKFTFFQFRFPVKATVRFESVIRMPDLLSLAAMKAFALAGRGKWRDYIDLYFILKDYYSISQIEAKALELFGELFNERLFREQLIYFKGVEHDQTIEFMNEPVSIAEIESFLTEVALDPL